LGRTGSLLPNIHYRKAAARERQQLAHSSITHLLLVYPEAEVHHQVSPSHIHPDLPSNYHSYLPNTSSPPPRKVLIGGMATPRMRRKATFKSYGFALAYQ